MLAEWLMLTLDRTSVRAKELDRSEICDSPSNHSVRCLAVGNAGDPLTTTLPGLDFEDPRQIVLKQAHDLFSPSPAIVGHAWCQWKLKTVSTVAMKKQSHGGEKAPYLALSLLTLQII